MTSVLNAATPKRLVALAFAACSLGISGARAQSTFDPYNPSTGQYREFVQPIYPSNLGLPGQARQALDLYRDTTYGPRVTATPFERFMRDGYDDIFSPGRLGETESKTTRPRSGAGVPYYLPQNDANRTYVPNREADKDFNAVRRERDRRYFEAIRERDPVKRAKLMRKVNEPIDPTEIRADATDRSDASAPPANASDSAGFRIARNRESGATSKGREPASATPPTRPSTRMPLAGESVKNIPAYGSASLIPSPMESLGITAAPIPRGTAPPPSRAIAPSSPSARRRAAAGPERRPLLPSELVDRNRREAGATATPPANAPPDR